ncbi:MAG: macro domain-containing protein [Myxococcales bacterium]|nr:macro domain-containing protein [Myxococcales bacterium]MCB9643470.1 macro domain-containing protein [Myxococcales bacterium]
MYTIQGDLLKLAMQGEFDVIVHGCNCFCTMGAGIAKSIKTLFPEAYEADFATPKGDKNKLGSYSFAVIEREDSRFTIVNAYTQFHWRGRGVKADYEAIKRVFTQIKADFSGKRIGYPKIGAGLAGGDWEQIAVILEKQLAGEHHTLVVFSP